MDSSQIAKAGNPTLKKILLQLYRYQTPEEQASESTIELNGAGFNHVDSEILSSYAEQVLGGAELSDKQYNVMKLRLPKYHGQVNEEALELIQLPEVTHVNGGNHKTDYSQVQVLFHPNKSIIQQDYAKAELKVAAQKYTGTLSIDPDNQGLMFTPARETYPSNQIKKLGFGSWKNGAWHQWTPKVFPQTIQAVKEMFGNVLVMPDVEEALAPKPMPKLPDWVDSYETLKDYQKEAIQVTANTPRLLLALAPRLGKSVVSILAAKVIGAKRILVVAPLSLLRDWKNKITQWGLTTDVAIVYKKNLPVPATWTVTNYDTVRLHRETFVTQNWDLIILDETLLIKNRKAKRTECIKDLVQNTHPRYIWGLSGAPTSRLYADMWAQLNVLDPKQFSGYWRFAETYCINQPNAYTQYNLVANKPGAAEAIKKDLAHIYYTRSQDDVTDMPELEPENLEVEMSNPQDKLYGEIEGNFLGELPEGESIFSPNILSQMVRLIQIASNPLLVGGKDDSPKWDALMEMLQYEEKPTIIWTSFIETVNQLQRRFVMKESIRYASLTGATKQEDRAEIVEKFQDGRLNVLIAHPAVGKYGLDLYNAKSVIYLERGYNPDDYYQSLNRVRSVDQKIAPHIVHLLSTRKAGGETIDHVVDTILRSRTDETRKLTTVGLRKMMGVE